jgi:AcrR family transcriptional regulator
VRRTRGTLQRALIGLVGEQDLSQITVADVADLADVSRSTFYDHYRDVHELAEAACTSMLDDMFRSVLAVWARDHPPETLGDPDPALTAFFAHLADHADLYRSLLGPTGSARVIEHVRRRTIAAAHYSGRLADATPRPGTAGTSEFPLDVPAAFVAGALLGVAADWLQRGCPRMPRKMTILTKPFLAGPCGSGAPSA